MSTQTEERLNQANSNRLRRAAEQQRVAQMSREHGQAHVADLLSEPPEWLVSASVGRVLAWPRHKGRRTTATVLARVTAAVGHYVSSEIAINELEADELKALTAVLRGERLRTASHRCSSCGFEKPYVEFALNGSAPTNGGGGWMDPLGTFRRSVCLRCRREHRTAVEGRDLLPIEPFAAWLERKLAHYKVVHGGGYKGFAATLCLAERRLGCYLTRAQETVSLSVVDRVLTHEGSTGLWELYGDLYE